MSEPRHDDMKNVIGGGAIVAFPWLRSGKDSRLQIPAGISSKLL